MRPATSAFGLCCLVSVRTPLSRKAAVYKIGAYTPGARNNTIVHEPYAGDLVWRDAVTALEARAFRASYTPAQLVHLPVHPFVVCEVSLPLSWEESTTLDPLVPLGGRHLRYDARIVRLLALTPEGLRA